MDKKDKQQHSGDQKPLVSVHIITYNQKQFIHETLLSVLNQDYENLEIVVADDGSTDGTAEIILEYARQYPGKIVPLVGGPNLGITRNCNRGLAACKGKYIAFLGGDDIFLPHKLSKQVEWLEADDARVLCYHDIEYFDSASGKRLCSGFEKSKPRSGGADLLIKHGLFFGGSSVMVRNPRHLNIIFNADIPVASDWLFWFEVVEKNQGKLGLVEGVYARYRRHAASVTARGDHGLHDMLKTVSVMRTYHKYGYECSQMEAQIYFLACIGELKKASITGFFHLFLKMMKACYFVPIYPVRLLFCKLLRLRV
jgi:glycosyltransferase involved in cell wall biosynthesis